MLVISNCQMWNLNKNYFVFERNGPPFVLEKKNGPLSFISWWKIMNHPRVPKLESIQASLVHMQQKETRDHLFVAYPYYMYKKWPHYSHACPYSLRHQDSPLIANLLQR